MKITKKWFLNKSKKYRENNKEKLSTKSKKYRENNREAILLKKKEYRENNKEKISESLKQWNENNKENQSKYKKQYREDNKEAISELLKQWRETEIGKLCMRNNRNKRRVTIGKGDVTIQQLKELYDKSTNCYYCKCDLSKEVKQVHLDHYIPISKGGLHTISNLVIACAFCNLLKGDKMPEEFIKLQGKIK